MAWSESGLLVGSGWFRMGVRQFHVTLGLEEGSSYCAKAASGSPPTPALAFVEPQPGHLRILLPRALVVALFLPVLLLPPAASD